MAEFYGVQTGNAQTTPTMIRVIRICRKCGAKIFSDVPEGLCARCVLKSALGNFPDAAVAGGVDPGRSDTRAAADENGAPNNKKSAIALSCSASWAITNYWKKLVAVVRVWCFEPDRKVSTAQLR